MKLNLKKIFLLPSLLLAQAYLLIANPGNVLNNNTQQNTEVKSDAVRETFSIKESSGQKIKNIVVVSLLLIISYRGFKQSNKKISNLSFIEVSLPLFFLFPKKYSTSLSV